MSKPKKYKLFVTDIDKFKGHEDEVFTETSLVDEETQDHFQAKIMVSQSPQEGYDELELESDRGYIATGHYVKIVERLEEEEESVTVFQSKRLGERRGYMLRSMMAEDKDQLKKETMTSELEKRLKRKQEIVQQLLKKKDKEKKE